MAFMGDFMNPAPLWQNGPSPGAFYNFPGNASNLGPAKHTLQDFRAHSATPITTTTTVIGVKFDKGCVIAADTLGSYGSLARFRDCPRVLKVNDLILLGSGGDYADYQYLKDIIEQKIIDEQCIGDGLQLKPKSLHCWLTRVLYNKRSKMDPLWNNYIVAGIQDGEPFLGAVDKLGTAYEDSTIATGLGAYMATPLLRDALSKGPLGEEAAKALVRKCMEVLFYRDARSFPRYQLGVVTADGVTVHEPVELKHDWSLAHMIVMKALVRKCMEVLFYRDARSFPRYQLGVVTADGVTVHEPVELKHDWSLAHMIVMKALVRKCMEVLFYRDARSFPRYQLGVVTADGVTVHEPVELKHDWSFAHMIVMK